MALVSMLTTVDNPFDPFDDWDNWFREDEDLARERGMRSSCSLLALYAYTSNDLSVADNRQAVNEAIDHIVKHDMTKMFKKVTRDIPDSDEPS